MTISRERSMILFSCSRMVKLFMPPPPSCRGKSTARQNRNYRPLHPENRARLDEPCNLPARRGSCLWLSQCIQSPSQIIPRVTIHAVEFAPGALAHPLLIQESVFLQPCEVGIYAPRQIFYAVTVGAAPILPGDYQETVRVILRHSSYLFCRYNARLAGFS